MASEAGTIFKIMRAVGVYDFMVDRVSGRAKDKLQVPKT